MYKNLKTLKQFEQFLEEAHKASQLGNKLKDGYVVSWVLKKNLLIKNAMIKRIAKPTIGK